jgi:hypothetical protein
MPNFPTKILIFLRIGDSLLLKMRGRRLYSLSSPNLAYPRNLYMGLEIFKFHKNHFAEIK